MSNSYRVKNDKLPKYPKVIQFEFSAAELESIIRDKKQFTTGDVPTISIENDNGHFVPEIRLRTASIQVLIFDSDSFS